MAQVRPLIPLHCWSHLVGRPTFYVARSAYSSWFSDSSCLQSLFILRQRWSYIHIIPVATCVFPETGSQAAMAAVPQAALAVAGLSEACCGTCHLKIVLFWFLESICQHPNIHLFWIFSFSSHFLFIFFILIFNFILGFTRVPQPCKEEQLLGLCETCREHLVCSWKFGECLVCGEDWLIHHTSEGFCGLWHCPAAIPSRQVRLSCCTQSSCTSVINVSDNKHPQRQTKQLNFDNMCSSCGQHWS